MPCPLCGKEHDILDCPDAVLRPGHNWFIAEFNNPDSAGRAIEAKDRRINYGPSDRQLYGREMTESIQLQHLLIKAYLRIQDLETLTKKLLILLGKAVDPKTSPGEWILIVTDYLAITEIPEVKELMKEKGK